MTYNKDATVNNNAPNVLDTVKSCNAAAKKNKAAKANKSSYGNLPKKSLMLEPVSTARLSDWNESSTD